MPVVADPDAVSFITAHGGCLYVSSDPSGRKHVTTEAPNAPSTRFEPIEADGFQLYVDEAIGHPKAWTVKLRRMPHHHVEVFWDSHPEHSHAERAVCVVAGHDWKPDPNSKGINPVLLCRRCGSRREFAVHEPLRDPWVGRGMKPGPG